MHLRTFALTFLVLSAISGNVFCQTWTEMAHVGRIDTIRASDIEAILVPAPGIYIAAGDGGIYRSSDGGSHWSAPWGLYSAELFGHPDGRIFAGMWNGLALSTDMGVTWNLLPGHPSVSTYRVARDSQGRLFTALWASSPTENGVCRSTDNGVTWSRVLNGFAVETVEAGPGDVIYAGGWELHRSTDSGQTWNMLYDSAQVRSVVVTQNGSILFGWYLTGPLREATYRSTDNGATWAQAAKFYSEYFAKDANNYVYVACDSGMQRTTDNGTTWQVLNTGLLNRNGAVPWLRTLTHVGADEFVAGEYHTGEIFRSTDLGAHWSTVSTVESPQPTSAKLSAIAFKKSDKLYLASSMFGMQQWTQGGGLVYVNSGLTNVKVQSVHVAENGDLFAGTEGGVFRSTNNGAGWVKFGTTSLLTRALVDLPNGTLLTGTAAGVVKFAADGSSFSAMNTGLVNRSVNALWAGTDGRTFVGTGDGLYRLDNVTWVPVNVSGGALKVIDIAVSGQTLALAAQDSGVYVSTDNGQLWQHKKTGIEGLAVRAIVLTAQDQLYAATENNGVFVTTAGSTSWIAAAGGMSDLRLRGLVLGPGGYLYAISDSGALSRSNSPVVAVSDLQSAHPLTFTLEQNYPNPFNSTTVVSYSVPPMAGRDLVSTDGRDGQLAVVSDVKLTVYDVLGRELAVLVNERKGPGSHTVTFDASGLASGVYVYRLEAGGFVASRKLLLVRCARGNCRPGRAVRPVPFCVLDLV